MGTTVKPLPPPPLEARSRRATEQVGDAISVLEATFEAATEAAAGILESLTTERPDEQP